MPSEHSPASRGERERFPEVAAAIGEDPARFLDQQLPTRAHVPKQLVYARIRGIDSLRVANAWLEVETSLERGPREEVVAAINRRKFTLREHGERPDDDQLAAITAAVRAEHPEWEDVDRPAVDPWRERVGVAVPTRDDGDEQAEELVTDGGSTRKLGGSSYRLATGGMDVICAECRTRRSAAIPDCPECPTFGGEQR